MNMQYERVSQSYVVERIRQKGQERHQARCPDADLDMARDFGNFVQYQPIAVVYQAQNFIHHLFCCLKNDLLLQNIFIAKKF